jgi:hypothetical protein
MASVPAEDEILKRKQERLRPQNQAVHKRDEQLKAAAKLRRVPSIFDFPTKTTRMPQA